MSKKSKKPTKESIKLDEFLTNLTEVELETESKTIFSLCETARNVDFYKSEGAVLDSFIEWARSESGKFERGIANLDNGTAKEVESDYNAPIEAENIPEKKNVISLCDFTGVFVDPWAKTHKCYIFDIQHPEFKEIRPNVFTVPGKIEDNMELISRLINEGVSFAAGFPPCTDLAVSGAAHFEKKRLANPEFQNEAIALFKLCFNICESTGAPFIIENPVSVASTLFKKPCYSFHPFEYGALLPENDLNPVSELIPPRDAYPKKTCLWTGGGFEMPEKSPVNRPVGYSPQHNKLGGKSLKTKNIRSATPRGFAISVFNKYGGI